MPTARGSLDRENRRARFCLGNLSIRAERQEAFDAMLRRMALHKELGPFVWRNRDGLSDLAVLLLLTGVLL